MVVAQVLAPGLKFLRRSAEPLTELRQRLSKAVRIEIGEPGCPKSIAKDPALWRRRPTKSLVSPAASNLRLGTNDNLRLRKERVFVLRTVSRRQDRPPIRQ